MIVVTGAAGFIGSCLISRLNKEGFNNLIAVDKFDRADKNKNLAGKNIQYKIDRGEFINWAKEKIAEIDFIFHLGARTDTTEFDLKLLNKLNTEYSKEIWSLCAINQIPLVYASSAATYGDGSNGYSDAVHPEKLQPLNPYGISKNDFDAWVLKQENRPFFWSGLKFFNVYGPNEYHKGRMASVVWHAFNQIQNTGKMKLFRSHKPEYRDGEQTRDFVYVEDVLNVCIWLMNNRNNSGIYNLGSGKGRSFNDLVAAIFKANDLESKIEYIDTPEDIRDKYQYFTEADMSSLRNSGYDAPFKSIEEGVEEYVNRYLREGRYY